MPGQEMEIPGQEMEMPEQEMEMLSPIEMPVAPDLFDVTAPFHTLDQEASAESPVNSTDSIEFLDLDDGFMLLDPNTPSE